MLRNQQNIHETGVRQWLKVIEVAITLIHSVRTLYVYVYQCSKLFCDSFQTEETLVELLKRIQFQDIMEQHSKDKSHANMQFFNDNIK